MRVALALFALVVVAVSVWFAGGSFDAVEPASPALLSNGVPELTGAALANADPAPSDGGDAEASPATAANRTATPDNRSAGLSVTVVDRAGQPLQDAEVFTETRATIRGDAGTAIVNWSEAFRSRGRRFVSDASGRVSLPDLGRGQDLHGFLGSRYGYLRLDSLRTEERLTLVLEQNLDLQVLVRDSEGALAEGVEVHAQLPGGIPTALGRTDAAGILRVLHLQEEVSFGATRTVGIYAACFGTKTDAQPVARDEPIQETLTFVLPATGSLAIRILDADGTPWDASSIPYREFYLAAFDAEDELVGYEARELGADGICTIAHVPLGLRFLFSGEQLLPDNPSFAGPTAASPHADVELRHPADSATLIGRVVDPEGIPLASAGLQVSVSRNAYALLTDGEGGIRISLPPLPLDEQTAITLERGREGELPLQATIRLTPTPGLHRVGDVVLRPPPTLASGRIVFPQGVDTQPPLMVDRQIEDLGWRKEPRTVAFDGDRFRIEGEEEQAEGTFRLRLVHHGVAYQPIDPILFRPGDEDLVVHLQTAGEIHARMRTDAETPWRSLEYEIEELASDGTLRRTLSLHHQPHRSAHSQMVRAEGSARLVASWHGLAAGSHRLKVLAPGLEEPVIALEDLVIPEAGGACEDPRLEELDLRGMKTAHIRLLDPQGQLLTHPNAVLAAPNGRADRWRRFRVTDGALDLPLLEPLRVWVFVPGFVALEVERIAGNRDLTLQKAAVLDLQVEHPELQPEQRIYAGLEVDPGTVELPALRGFSPPQVHRMLLDMRPVDEAGRVQLPIGVPGAYRIRFSRRDQGMVQHSALHDPPDPLVLDPRSGGRYAVSLDAATLGLDDEKGGR